MGIHNTCILKNPGVSDLIVRGQVILGSGGTYEIIDEERQWFAFDTPLQGLINSGDIVVNDGTSDLNIADGFELLRLNYTADAVRIQNTRVDASAISDQRVLLFEGSSNRVIYQDLSQIGGSGRTIELVLVKDETKPFLETSSLNFRTLAYAVFPGTGNSGPPSLTRLIAFTGFAGKFADFQINDLNNATVLTQLLNISVGVPTLFTMTQINPYPVGATILEFQARKGQNPGSAATAILAAAEILF